MDSDEMMEVEKDNGETIYLERRERPKHVPIKNEHDEIEFAKV
jgi:hypothetical protein